MGKSTISMAMFNSYVTNYQRVMGCLPPFSVQPSMQKKNSHHRTIGPGAFPELAPWIASGKLTVCCGKSPCYLGKATINHQFFIAMLVYQRVSIMAWGITMWMVWSRWRLIPQYPPSCSSALAVGPKFRACLGRGARQQATFAYIFWVAMLTHTQALLASESRTTGPLNPR